ncbi:MAG: transcriptional repressor [Bacteroidales bacterium]|nr:transcriptional repressor [Bacteroidales bacterium]
MTITNLKNRLVAKGLRVTPQRLAILEAFEKLHNHPTAEKIYDYIRKKFPNVAEGTVYKVLDTLVSNQLVRKVNTEKDIMRYDAILERHHHLYCPDSERIEDYFDEELNHLIEKHFKNKEIPGFKIEEIRLQLIGKFKNLKSNTV